LMACKIERVTMPKWLSCSSLILKSLVGAVGIEPTTPPV
jgi:hypothetical protein